MSNERTDRRTPRAMLAEIALTDIPMPKTVEFLLDISVLALCFRTLNEGQQWSSHLGGQTTIYLNSRNNRRHLAEGCITWHGWSVQIHASEPATDAPLPADTADELAQLIP